MKVSEIFKSLQGEGCLAGEPSIFLRLTGCNLRCPRCDTAYAFNEGEELTPEQVALRLKTAGLEKHGHLVITGGEPLLHPHFDKIIEFVYSLKKKN